MRISTLPVSALIALTVLTAQAADNQATTPNSNLPPVIDNPINGQSASVEQLDRDIAIAQKRASLARFKADERRSNSENQGDKVAPKSVPTAMIPATPKLPKVKIEPASATAAAPLKFSSYVPSVPHVVAIMKEGGDYAALIESGDRSEIAHTNSRVLGLAIGAIDANGAVIDGRRMTLQSPDFVAKVAFVDQQPSPLATTSSKFGQSTANMPVQKSSSPNITAPLPANFPAFTIPTATSK